MLDITLNIPGSSTSSLASSPSVITGEDTLSIIVCAGFLSPDGPLFVLSPAPEVAALAPAAASSLISLEGIAGALAAKDKILILYYNMICWKINERNILITGARFIAFLNI